jgi:hypothetical protein
MFCLNLDVNSSKAREVRSRTEFIWLAFLFFLIALPVDLCAQTATARVNGSVVDPSSALVPGAKVTATENATGVISTTTTNGDGIFAFPSLAVGSYTVGVDAQGFQLYRQTGLALTVGQDLNLKISLTIGASDQVITVDAAAVAVDSNTPTEQATIEEKVVRDLPLNGRNPASLMYTVAGTTNALLNGGNGRVSEGDAQSPQESAPTVRGSRPGGTYFSLDGTNNTDPFSVIGGPFPNPDATGQFSVVTGTYGARYVSAPGGAINIVTKAGTNDIHGSVFEFIRNGYFNARNALSTAPDILKRNQFGFAVGAPILKNRLFAFASYQGTITHNNQTSTTYVPTAQQREGNFGTFQIPSSMLSPAIQKILPLFPLGDPNTGFISYQSPANTDDKQATAKIDYTVHNHNLFARGFYDRYVLEEAGPTASALILPVKGGTIQPWLSLAAGDTWTKSSWVFDSRASYLNTSSSGIFPPPEFGFDKMGINNMSGVGYSLLFVIGGFIGQGGGGADTRQDFPRKVWELSESVSALKGKHQFSFGANYRRISLNENQNAGNNPVGVFVGVNSLLDGAFGIIPGATFNAMADFMMGAPYIFIQKDGIFSNVTGNLLGFYGEDNVRVTDRLTATVGLRWDPYLPYTPVNQRITCFVLGQQSKVFTNASPGLVFPGDPGCPHNGIQRTLAEFEPSAGLAYRLDNKGQSVVRAGYGRYDLQLPLNTYDTFSASPYTRSFQLQQPFLRLDDLWASAGMANPFASGFQGASYNPPSTVTFPGGQALYTFASDFHPAYIQQWSLSLQQLISRSDSLELAYVGTAGVHLTIDANLNTPVYIPGASSTANEQQRRPHQKFTDIHDLTSAGTSSYNGVDVVYHHQSKTMVVNSAFTWSKSLDNVSVSGFPGLNVQSPNLNHNFRRGRSDYDQNFTFRNTVVWTSPELSKASWLLRAGAGSWQLSGLLTLDAGQPFSVTDGADNSYTGAGLDLADRVPNVSVYKDGRLNRAAFVDNAPGTFGNSGRNAFRGPSVKDIDIAVMKNLPTWERLHSVFRAEAFNLFNHPNYGPPNASYSTPVSFGQNSFARDPRILQFSLKLSF